MRQNLMGFCRIKELDCVSKSMLLPNFSNKES